MTHLISNTDKVYPCITCGSTSANIVRESMDLSMMRVKCSECGMLYTAADSKDLEEKGQIPDGPPDIPEVVQHRDDGGGDGVEDHAGEVDLRLPRDSKPSYEQGSVPKTPSFVFISRDRSTTEFCTKRDLKKTTLSWEHKGLKYNVYELVPKKISAKIDIA